MPSFFGEWLADWSTEERARVARARMRALNRQLQTLMRETYDFGAQPKPRPRKGMEDVASRLKELFGQWVQWYQQAIDQPDQAYETEAIPSKLDEYADRYARIRRAVAKRLKLQGKRTQTASATSIQEATDPGMLDQLIRAPGASMGLIVLGAGLVIAFMATRE